MNTAWADALPNLMIGLREGLEAGLIITILISAVRKLAPDRSLAPVWLGVATALALSLSFGFVLTFTASQLSSTALATYVGVLSVIAVSLITWMVFWMRKTAASMSGDLTTKTSEALALGATALAVTSFVAVGREGLETALFVWTNLQAAGESVGPIIGAVVGLAIAAALCVGIYKRAVKLNFRRFFTITGSILIVISAGVLAYGIGDLQEAGILPGQQSKAFDVSSTINNQSWWFQIIRGVFNIDTIMTWFQVIAYVLYLGITLTLFLVTGARLARPQQAAAPATTMPPALLTPRVSPSAAGNPARSPMTKAHKWEIGGAVVAVPVVLAVAFALAFGSGGPQTAQAVEVTSSACVPSWNAPPAGQSTFTVKNSSDQATDIELVTSPGGLIVAEIEVLGPSTSRDLPVNLADGQYQWRCVTGGGGATYSSVQQTTGTATGGSFAFAPVTATEIAPYLEQYRIYVGAQLRILDTQVAALRTAINTGNRASAQAAWLPGQLTYHRIGAAYGAFGEDGEAVNGLAQSLEDGPTNPDFAGFHRIEYQLWSGAPMAQIKPTATDLAAAVRRLEKQLPTFTFDPLEVVIRAHEILEDTQRFVVTGQDDYGSGTSYAHAVADTEGTRKLLRILAPLLATRQPTLAPTAAIELDRLQKAALATRRNGEWVPVAAMPLPTRTPTNAALGQALETLAPIPDILEIQQ